MNHSIRMRRNPPVTSRAVSGRGRADRIRFAAGIAVACAGAGALLADIVHHLV